MTKTEIDVDALMLQGVFHSDTALSADGGALLFSGKTGSLTALALALNAQAARQYAIAEQKKAADRAVVYAALHKQMDNDELMREAMVKEKAL